MWKEREMKRFVRRLSLMARMRLSRLIPSRRLIMGIAMCFTYLVTFHGSSSSDSTLEFDPIGTRFESTAEDFSGLSRLAAVEGDGSSVKMAGDGDQPMQMKRLLNALQRETARPLRFMLVTGESSSTAPCKTEQGSHLMMKSLKNKVDYCNLHGCEVWHAMESWEAGSRGTTWAKYHILKRLMLTHPHVQWFMWMDSDALFTDLTFTVPFALYGNKNLILPGNWEKVYTKDPDWRSFNSGIFLVRNCEWSQRFLEKWADFGRPESRNKLTAKLNAEFTGRPKHVSADDQSALIYLLRQNLTELKQKAFLEASYSLHGFWEHLDGDSSDDQSTRREAKLEKKGGGRSWPFITHFYGCNLCSGEYATWKSSLCVDNFERAYHSGDNQLLAFAGLRHLHLNSPMVVPLLPTSVTADQ